MDGKENIDGKIGLQYKKLKNTAEKRRTAGV